MKIELEDVGKLVGDVSGKTVWCRAQDCVVQSPVGVSCGGVLWGIGPVRADCTAKDRLHSGHWKGRSFLCTRLTWSLLEENEQNVLLQPATTQETRLEPVCIFSCFVRADLALNSFEQ